MIMFTVAMLYIICITYTKACAFFFYFSESIVERLLQKKIRRGRIEYLVKWEGYSDPTWAPCKNIPMHFRKSFKQLSVVND